MRYYLIGFLIVTVAYIVWNEIQKSSLDDDDLDPDVKLRKTEKLAQDIKWKADRLIASIEQELEELDDELEEDDWDDD